MGHDVATSVLASKLNQAMGVYLNPFNTRSMRRGWESKVISSYNTMISNLNSMMSSVGFGTISEADRYNDPVGKKKTHDALAGAIGGFEGTTVPQLEASIAHDVNELIRLETIKGGENVYDPLTQFDDLIEGGIVSELTDKISQKTDFLNSYNGAGVFLDIFGLVDKQKKTLELRKSIEMEKNRIIFEDELSEEAIVANFDKIARDTLLNYTTLSTQNNTTIEEYNIWLLQEEKIKSDLEKERLSIQTQTPEEIHEQEVIISDTVTTGSPTDVIIDDSFIPVKKTIGVGILALGAIGILLALKYNKK